MEQLEVLYTIATYVSGFVDFIIAVAVIILALTSVRRADPTAGYVLAAAMGINFLASCCVRGVGQVPDSMGGDAVMIASAGLAVIRPFFVAAQWAGVIFVLVQLAKKAAPSGPPT